jgi:hypothetical protein
MPLRQDESKQWTLVSLGASLSVEYKQATQHDATTKMRMRELQKWQLECVEWGEVNEQHRLCLCFYNHMLTERQL